MKLVSQTILYFKKGTSDKVYEVDLCEAGEGEFLVNFRYGRRGARLREGTKTPFPESRATAEAIFQKLVQSKVTKGYSEDATLTAPAPQLGPTNDSAPAASDPRVQAILNGLKLGGNGARNRVWKLSRIIWRAGEWKVTEAAPLLSPLVQKVDEMEAWCLAWAIGRCGNEAQLPDLEQLRERFPKHTLLHRIIEEAHVALLPESQQEAFLSSVKSTLPADLTSPIDTNQWTLFTANLESLLLDGAPTPDLGASLYLIARCNPELRNALYQVAKRVPINGMTMPYLRRLFKASELRMDAEMFGMLAKKFEQTQGNPVSWDRHGRRTRTAFTSSTRSYLRKRVVRHLKQLGKSDRAELFIPLATGVLLSYNDEKDSPEVTSRYDYNWETRTYQTSYYPRYRNSHAFIWLVRGASQNLEFVARSVMWRFPTGQDAAQPAEREKPFSHLWDQAPDAVMHLLRYGRSEEAQLFGHRIWQANPSFKEEVNTPFIADLLASWFDASRALGLELAKEAWDASAPDGDLLIALLSSPHDEARAMGGANLKHAFQVIKDSPVILAALAFVEPEDSRTAIKEAIGKLLLSPEIAKGLVARVISGIIALDRETAELKGPFASELLWLAANRETEQLGLEHIAELAAHDSETAQLLAVRILNARGNPERLTDALLLAPLSSEYESVRRLGLELLDQLPSFALSERGEVIAGCGVSQHADLREAVRPLIQKMATSDRAFARGLVESWYPLLFRQESFDGLHEDVLSLLIGPLEKHLDAIPEESFRRMLQSDYRCGQILGLKLLRKQADFTNEPHTQLLDWANHELTELRGMICHFWETHPDSLTVDPGNGLQLLESSWPDTRDWAMQFYKEKVPESAWDAAALVTMCDSTEPAVQDYGRQMITRLFKEEDGITYLERLSQHPSAELQLFATHYLQRFAGGETERVLALEPYFRVILSRVGAGRVAKDRVFLFLEQEGMENESIAHFVTDLINHLSATIAIGDKARCISLLHKLEQRWPEISPVLIHRNPEIYQPE